MDLSPDALVIRGGSVRDALVVLGRVEAAISRHQGAVVSVWADDAMPGETRSTLLRRLCWDARVPHGKIQVATAGGLLERGFTLTRDTSDGQPPCHHHVGFPEPVTESTAASFVEAFDEPEPNPMGGVVRA